MQTVDHASPVPLYYQLKQLLLQQIESGALQPGDQIPTEAELCQQYSISRTPVRQALLELVHEGLLTRTVGRGTFVAPRHVQTIILQITLPDERWQWPLAEAARLWNEKRQPRLELSFNTVALHELHDHLAFAVAQGQAPDIAVLDSVWVAEFAHRRYLRALAEIDPQWTAKISADLFPALLRANSYDNQPYAVPTNADASVLWYRRDWFRKEDLSPPATWKELVSAARHFQHSSTRRRYGLGPHPLAFVAGRAAGETTTYQLLPFFRANRADILRDDIVVLNNTAACEALSYLQSLLHEKLVSPAVTQQPWDGAWRAFAQGEAAMAFGGTYENFLIQSAAGWNAEEFAEHAGFVPLPAGPRGNPSTLVGGMTYGIYRQSQHAAEALGLLKLALTPPILRPFSRQTAQNPGLLSVSRTLTEEEDPFLTKTARLFTGASSRPSLPTYDLVSTQFQEMVELCLEGQLAPEAAIRRAAERIGGITTLPTLT